MYEYTQDFAVHISRWTVELVTHHTVVLYGALCRYNNVYGHGKFGAECQTYLEFLLQAKFNPCDIINRLV